MSRHIQVNADKVIAWLEKLEHVIQEGRDFLAHSFTLKPLQNKSINLANITFYLPKKAGGGQASPHDSWAYAWIYNQNEDGTPKAGFENIEKAFRESKTITVEHDGIKYELGLWAKNRAVYRKKLS